MCVLIVNVIMGFSTLIEFIVFTEGFIICYDRIERFAGCKGSLELCPFLCRFCLTECQGTPMEVVPPLTGLSSLSDMTSASYIGRTEGHLLSSSSALNCVLMCGNKPTKLVALEDFPVVGLKL